MISFDRSRRLALLASALPASLLLLSAPACAQSAFSEVDRTASAQVTFSAGERGKPILAGSQVTIAGENFRPNQRVSLLYGTSPLPGGDLVADAQGKIAGTITVPAEAVAGIHPIVVVSHAPYHALVSELKVSPTIPLSGQGGYTVTQSQVVRGLYQAAYSPKTNTLFVAASIGRPPVSQSELVKLDADTLKVLARTTPPEAPPSPRPAGGGPAQAPQGQGGPGGPGGSAQAPQGPGVYAVYGIGVDDSKGTVWATNTRQNTVAVYRQSDLSLIKQFPAGTVEHARDVVIDQAAAKAYVGATTTPDVVVIDTNTMEVAKTIPIRSTRRGEEFSVGSLSLDTRSNRIYAASLSSSEVAIIDTRTGEVEKVLPVPGAKGTIGVSHDPQTGRIYVAGQGSDTLTVLDGRSGEVIANTPIGAGALNVAFDPVKRRAYVANRGAGTIAVTDPDGRILANLGPAPLANHVALGRNGTVYAVDKSAGRTEGENDTIMKIVPKR